MQTLLSIAFCGPHKKMSSVSSPRGRENSPVVPTGRSMFRLFVTRRDITHSRASSPRTSGSIIRRFGSSVMSMRSNLSNAPTYANLMNNQRWWRVSYQRFRVGSTVRPVASSLPAHAQTSEPAAPESAPVSVRMPTPTPVPAPTPIPGGEASDTCRPQGHELRLPHRTRSGRGGCVR